MSDTEPARPAWHALEAQDVLVRLQSTADGLSRSEAAARLQQHGPNVLETTPPTSAWYILWEQLRSVVVALLFVAAVLALVMSDHLEAGAIVAVLVINTLIGFLVELRARRAMEALLGLEVPHATALRDGRTVFLDARELVPGDVIVLEAGQAVPADARLLRGDELRVNEAALTGESVAAEKNASRVADADAAVADRSSMIYKSTIVVAGHAQAVVTATGGETEVGRIGRLTSALGEERTPLEERLDTLGRRLVWLTLGIAGLIVLLGVVRGFPCSK